MAGHTPNGLYFGLPLPISDEIDPKGRLIALGPIAGPVSGLDVVQGVSFHASPSYRGYMVDCEAQRV